MEQIDQSNSGHDVRPPSCEMTIKVGLDNERRVTVAFGSRLTAVVEVFAREFGCEVAELVVFREGDDAPLSELGVIEAEYPHHRRHHLHRTHAVKVTVHYQTDSKHHEFVRRATVEQVLVWALKNFPIDPGMAGEFELARHEQKEELPPSEHVGHLAGHHHSLELDLVRGDIANGSAS